MNQEARSQVSELARAVREGELRGEWEAFVEAVDRHLPGITMPEIVQGLSSKGDVLLRAVPAIRAIIEHGTIVHREPGSRSNVVERIVISAPVEVMGETRHLAVSVHQTRDGRFHYDFTFDRDAGRPGDSVPGGLAKQSRRSAEEGAPGISMERTPGVEPRPEGWKPSALPTELYPLPNAINLFVLPGERKGSAFLIREQTGSVETEFVLTDAFIEKADELGKALRKELDGLGLSDVGLRVSEKISAIADGQRFEADGQYFRGRRRRLGRQRERNLSSQDAFDSGMASIVKKMEHLAKRAEALSEASNKGH